MGEAARKKQTALRSLNRLKGAELRKALAAIGALYGDKALRVLFGNGLPPLPARGAHSGVRYAQPLR